MRPNRRHLLPVALAASALGAGPAGARPSRSPARPDPADPAPAAGAWTLTFDHTAPVAALARSDGHIAQPLTPAGRFLAIFFAVRNDGERAAYLTGNDFWLTDAQGRGYRSSFELQGVQADGGNASIDSVPLLPGATVAASLTFDVAVDADGLVLHVAGAAAMPVPAPAARA